MQEKSQKIKMLKGGKIILQMVEES